MEAKDLSMQVALKRKNKVLIRGDVWQIGVAAKDHHDSMVEEGMLGYTYRQSHWIVIREDNINLETILHEVWHAYCTYFYLGSTNSVSVKDFEEMTADLFALCGDEMLKKAKEIKRKLWKNL